MFKVCIDMVCPLHQYLPAKQDFHKYWVAMFSAVGPSGLYQSVNPFYIKTVKNRSQLPIVYSTEYISQYTFQRARVVYSDHLFPLSK